MYLKKSSLYHCEEKIILFQLIGCNSYPICFYIHVFVTIMRKHFFLSNFSKFWKIIHVSFLLIDHINLFALNFRLKSLEIILIIKVFYYLFRRFHLIFFLNKNSTSNFTFWNIFKWWFFFMCLIYLEFLFAY